MQWATLAAHVEGASSTPGAPASRSAASALGKRKQHTPAGPDADRDSDWSSSSPSSFPSPAPSLHSPISPGGGLLDPPPLEGRLPLPPAKRARIHSDEHEHNMEQQTANDTSDANLHWSDAAGYAVPALAAAVLSFPLTVCAPAVLHRDAIQSVLCFLNLRELGLSASVCKRWEGCIRQMSGSNRRFNHRAASGTSLATLARSAVAGHLRKLELASADESGLMSLAERMPRLVSLEVVLTGPISASFRVPRGLRHLQLKSDFSAETALESSQNVINAIASLDNLAALALELPALPDGADIESLQFTSLGGLSKLQGLDFRWTDNSTTLPDSLVQAIRRMSTLRDLQLFSTLRPLSGGGRCDAASLARLVAEPHQLKLQRLALRECTEAHVPLLQRLPSLTVLQPACFLAGASELQFLRSFPNLRTLTLSSGQPHLSAEQLVAGVRECKALTELTLSHARLTHAHMDELLSGLPALQKLSLWYCHSLTSLQFLTSQALRRSLHTLSLYNCRALRARELVHVLKLGRLQLLRLRDCFGAPLDDFTRSLFSPPCRSLRALKQFDYAFTQPQLPMMFMPMPQQQQQQPQQGQQPPQQQQPQQGQQQAAAPLGGLVPNAAFWPALFGAGGMMPPLAQPPMPPAHNH